MTLEERLKADATAALKGGDRARVHALRLVLSEVRKAHKESGGRADEQAVLRRERKRRRDAEAAYRDAGRDEQAAQEAAEADLIEAYLPAELSDAELEGLVRQAVSETGAQGPNDMGAVIRRVMDSAEGRADGKRVSAKVREALPA